MSREFDARREDSSMDGRPTRAAVIAGTLAGLLAPLLLPAAAPAQEGIEGPEERTMADAPKQFRLSAAGGWVEWTASGRAEQQDVEGAAAWGLDLETRVHPLLSFRFGGAYGRTTISGLDTGGRPRSVETTQYLLELVAEPRLSVGPLRDAGVVPFGLAGFGSVVHDPRNEPGEFDPPLTTRSQGSLIYGAGLDLSPGFLGRLGARAEWRRAEVQMQDLFAVTSREGTSRTSDRFMGTVYWSF